MRKLLSLEPPQIQSGIYPGVGKAAAPLWHDGNNIVFDDFGVKRINGSTEVLGAYTAPSTIRALAQGFSAGKPRVYIGNDTKLQMLERTAGVWVASDLYTWPTASDYQQLETWGNWLIGTNDVDPVVVWKNAGAAAALAGTTFTRARLIRRMGTYLLALNTNVGEDRIEWSAGVNSNIEDWAPSLSTGAGGRNVRDLESGIVAAEPLGDRLAIYSSATLALATYVGNPNWWGTKKAIGGIGAVSAKSVVEQGVFHYGLMQNGIFVTDGNSSQFIDDPMMQKWIIDNVNWDQAKYIWGFHDDHLRAATWNFLNVDLQWRSVSYHYDTKLFTKGNLQMTAGGARSSLSVPVVAGGSRKVYEWQRGLQFEGVDVPFTLRSKPLDFGARDVLKLLQMIKVDGQWDSSIRLRVGALDDSEGTPEWYHDQPLVGMNYFPEEREARYFTIEFYGSKPWYISGMEFHGLPGGVGA